MNFFPSKMDARPPRRAGQDFTVEIVRLFQFGHVADEGIRLQVSRGYESNDCFAVAAAGPGPVGIEVVFQAQPVDAPDTSSRRLSCRTPGSRGRGSHEKHTGRPVGKLTNGLERILL